MTIAVIGGGAMGSLFASRLVLAGRKIWIFDKCREHVEAINRDGLKITRDGVTRSLRIPATTVATNPGVGPLIAATVRTVVQDAHGFKTGRDFAAWIGLTRRAHSSGGKERLGAISSAGISNELDRRPQLKGRLKVWDAGFAGSNLLL
ncbi:transposase [Nitrobacteraceae bacterium AZCC 2161]